MKKLLTNLILKFTFGKLEPMQKHIRDIVEQLVFWSFYIGLITGVLIFFIIYLIAN